MRCRNSRSFGLARVQVPALRSVDDERGQNAGRISAGIDADTVGPLLDLGPDGMPVNHDEPVVGVVGEERLADPPQVELGLLVERDSWRIPA